MKKIISFFGGSKENDANEEEPRGKSTGSVYSTDSAVQQGPRVLSPTWPTFELSENDSVDYDDDVSIVSVDMSVWKSADTDNEAPPIISKKELSKHNTTIDAWISIHGLVYDVTTFLSHHPGGSEQLMRGAGTDATSLFMKVHPRVNVRNYVGHHGVGVYIASGTSPCSLKSVVSKGARTGKVQHYGEDGEQEEFVDKRCWLMQILKEFENPEGKFELNFTQNEFIIVLFVKAPAALDSEDLNSSNWTFVLWDQSMLYIKVMWAPQKCWVANYRLTLPLDSEYMYVSFKERNQATIMIPKGLDQKNWNHFGRPSALSRNCMVQDPVDVEFDDSTRALLFYRKQINEKIVLYGFKLRPSSYFGVNIGYSLVLTVNETAARVYPTTFTLLGVQEPICEIKGQTFYFMIPQNFTIAHGLNSLRSMNEKEMLETSLISLGNPKGDFQWHFLDNADTLVLLASGIGIAPLSRVLKHFEDKHPEHLKNNQVLLLYFNKTSTDIIWHKELMEASQRFQWFHLFLIIEEVDASWDQLIGTISVHLLKWCIQAIPGVCADGLVINGLASGNPHFLDECERVFQNMQDVFDNAAVFHSIKEVAL